MITYTNEEAKKYTEQIVNAQHFGLLQAWRLDPDPKVHTEEVLSRSTRLHIGSLSPKSILDIGCGTGEWLFQAGDMWPHAKLYGVNLFPSQLPTNWVTPDLHLKTGAFEDVDLPKGFDLVTVNYTLGHFDDLHRVFSKIKSLLAPKGRVAIYDICRRSVLYDSVFGYKLWSKRGICRALSHVGFLVNNQVGIQYELDPMFDEVTKEEFRTKTCPIFITGGL